MELREFGNELTIPPWDNPFGPISLSESEKNQLRQLAQSIVDGTIEEYEEFSFHNGCKLVPETQWKFLRRDSEVESYVRRREKYGLNGFGTRKRLRYDSNSETSNSVNSTQSDEITSLDVVDVRSIGFTNGTKEDAVYGVMNPTTITMRIKSAYVDDGVRRGNVFSVIQNSTPEEPFSTLSVRWRVTVNPPVLNWLVKSYDHVYIDSTGVTTLSNGEQVTYQLLHSIDFPKMTPPLPQFSRGQVAGIVFYRQVDENLVSIWARGVFTVPMERARTFFEPVVGSAMSKSVMNNFHAAQMKKLRWALHRRRKENAMGISSDRSMIERSTSSMSSRSSTIAGVGDKICIMCSKKRKLRTGDSCDLCSEHVCGACCIKHKVAAVDSANKLQWLKVRVCSFCMAKVVKMDAREAIAIEYAAGEYDRIN